MRFLHALTEWRATRYEKNMEKMKAQGKCPACRGNGLHPLPIHEFAYVSLYDCPGCSGSGLYSDWAAMNGQTD
ncbi:methionine aminopeptidase [Aneurinibacillus sp. REN35]|uniref:methionine aminopeptidase n=1 Tax=Aneurinibacillus sp. REN35 TaxID=3237286 RepID=UPI0035299F3B